MRDDQPISAPARVGGLLQICRRARPTSSFAIDGLLNRIVSFTRRRARFGLSN